MSFVVYEDFNSSNISKISYYKEEMKLRVLFHSGGAYQYSNISESLWEEFKAAPSQGKFFGANIKDKNEFNCIKISSFDE